MSDTKSTDQAVAWMRIDAEPADGKRHGGLRVTGSGIGDELWIGWEGLLERLDEAAPLPAVFRVGEAP